MQVTPKKNLLKWVMTWNCEEDECTEEFLYELRGKMAFDLETEYPLLKNISQDDMQYKRNIVNFEPKYYHITFSEEFKLQIEEHYPEHLI